MIAFWSDFVGTRSTHQVETRVIEPGLKWIARGDSFSAGGLDYEVAVTIVKTFQPLTPLAQPLPVRNAPSLITKSLCGAMFFTAIQTPFCEFLGGNAEKVRIGREVVLALSSSRDLKRADDSDYPGG